MNITTHLWTTGYCKRLALHADFEADSVTPFSHAQCVLTSCPMLASKRICLNIVYKELIILHHFCLYWLHSPNHCQFMSWVTNFHQTTLSESFSRECDGVIIDLCCSRLRNCTTSQSSLFIPKWYSAGKNEYCTVYSSKMNTANLRVSEAMLTSGDALWMCIEGLNY